MLSKRAQMLKPSPTLALAARAKELTAQGKDIVSLSVGEPDWPTFPAAVKAGIAAIEAGQTKYGPSNGLPELRKVVAELTAQDTGVDYKPNDVSVTAGGKFVIFAALQALCDPGDEVLIPAPYWVSYPTMVELADGKPVIVETQKKNLFKMTSQELSAAITPRTKILILNSPSNPTGEVYSKGELLGIVEVLKKNPQIIVLSDDIYNRLVFDGKVAPHILHIAPELKDRTIIINGASKTLSMTGWRVGWSVGPQKIIQAMTDYQSQSVSCAAAFSQIAAMAALKDSSADLENSLKTLKERRDFAFDKLSKIAGIEVTKPGGAFYLWPSIEKFIGKRFKDQVIKDSSDFCKFFLEDYGVAVVPGKEFGTEGYLRMSYVLAKPRMEEAFSRLAKFVSEIK